MKLIGALTEACEAGYAFGRRLEPPSPRDLMRFPSPRLRRAFARAWQRGVDSRKLPTVEMFG